ncbi:MAG: hypothetical protein MSA01_06540 [Anaeromassilibacillus sp.]|nr:hypothetical protein [Anaeromassilibacillus sp.]MDY3780558.1 hypothetical protein [Candidatus Limousia pullorum]
MNLFVIGADEDIENILKDLGEAFFKVEEEAEKILKELEEVFSSVEMEKEKLPKPCKSIGEPHTKPLCRQFKDHRNSRKYWRR